MHHPFKGPRQQELFLAPVSGADPRCLTQNDSPAEVTTLQHKKPQGPLKEGYQACTLGRLGFKLVLMPFQCLFSVLKYFR